MLCYKINRGQETNYELICGLSKSRTRTRPLVSSQETQKCLKVETSQGNICLMTARCLTLVSV